MNPRVQAFARATLLMSMLAGAAPALGAAAAGAPADAIQPIVTLRDSGYLLGDLIDERIDLTLPPGFELDADSLPLPGRVAPWMEVRRARSEPGHERGEFHIVVTYQIFAEVEQAERVPIPPFKLRARSGATTRNVDVPERSILLSPALPASLADEDRELKPSLPPLPLPLARLLAALGLCVVLAAAAGLYLLWVHDRLPFFPRAPGPFARMWRRWRRRGRRGLSPDEQTALLRDWHAALNHAAGETLYASTLPRLFVRAPHLEPLRDPVADLFARSWRFFYVTPAPSQPPPAADVLRLLRAAAERERGVPC